MRALIVSFLVVLTVPLCLSLFAALSYLRQHRSSMMELYKVALNRNVATISDAFTTYERYVYLVSDSQTAKQLMGIAEANEVDIGILLDIDRYIPSHSTFSAVTSSNVLHRIILFYRSGIVVYDSSVYLSSYWMRDYSIAGNSISRWKELVSAQAVGTRMFSSQIDTAITGPENGSTIIYAATLPMGYTADAEAVLILCIDKDKMERQVFEGLDAKDRYFELVDDHGHIVLSAGTDLRNRERMVEFTLTSYNGWSYSWWLPNTYVESRIRHTILVLGIVTSTLIVIGIAVAVLMAYRQNRPFREISRILSTEKDLEAEENYDVIKKNIKTLINEVNSLESMLQRNEALVRTSILDRLLEGKAVESSVIRDMMARSGLSLSREGYRVSVLQIMDVATQAEGIYNIQIQRSVLLSFIGQLSPKVVVHPIDLNRIAVIHDRPENIQHYVAELGRLLLQKGHSNVSIGVGTTCSDIAVIHESYTAACVAIEHGAKGEFITYYQNTASETCNRLPYSINDEQRIISAVCGGSEEECTAILDRIYTDTCKETGSMLRKLFVSEIAATLLKAVANENPSDLSAARIDTDMVLGSLGGEDTESDFVRLREYFVAACSYFHHRRRESTNDMVKNIREYLENEFTDQQMSLTSLADRFDLSEAYLSHLFKEHSGENFSSYLERIRMNFAHGLLTETDTPIADIAKRIGYGSADTFRRAFKRFHGITPAEYRVTTARIQH